MIKRVGNRTWELVLINYECSVIKVKKEYNVNGVLYIFIDQWDMEILMCNTTDLFYSFISGGITLFDSNGNKWNFKKEHKESRVNSNDIIKFAEL